ncbi:uncharacterized protein BXZ73DRAFT_108834 [Epithele typhae]|uniref:uncharacterized protein n=1 Tax=Epithele typhae TaxID=378194 RepID=UPI00200769D3|nr:uncharacterized protein BXZ73DRAFT_108834 [Epithele typhae]KAH9910518.1 hypothetical protein BXZ73DRAFT_108834 [Epithele typhae]
MASFFTLPPLPAPITLLTAETELNNIALNIFPGIHKEITIDNPAPRTVRFSTPTFNHSTGPPSDSPSSDSPSSNPRSLSPQDSLSEPEPSSEQELAPGVFSLDQPKDAQLEEVVIPKPPGEAGRPGHGGYTLATTLGWVSGRFESFRDIVHELVDEHLDLSKSYQSQRLSSLSLVHKQKPSCPLPAPALPFPFPLPLPLPLPLAVPFPLPFTPLVVPFQLEYTLEFTLTLTLPSFPFTIPYLPLPLPLALSHRCPSSHPHSFPIALSVSRYHSHSHSISFRSQQPHASELQASLQYIRDTRY